MSLLNNILPKNEKEEYFLTLGVEEHKISAAVAIIAEKEIKILGVGESEFKKDDEIEAADIAISTAEKQLPKDILVKRTIFALPATFLDKEKVKEEYLVKLQKIAKELDLNPTGFIVYPDALSSYLEKKEESPPTLILLSIGRENLTFSLVRVGKVESNTVVPRSPSIAADLEKILESFVSEILPSRIIIYDEVKGAQLEELKEELMRIPWHKHSSFLHTPKIESLDENVVITALVEAGAGSLIKEFQFEEQKEPEQAKDKKEEERETFGFIEEKIISEAEKNVNPPETIEFKEEKNDIIIPKISIPLASLLKLLPIIAGLGIIFPLFILILLFTYLFPKTRVNLIVYPEVISQQTNVIFTTEGNSVNIDKNIFLVKRTSEETEDTKSISTTGKTKIGEHARGEIIIYNKTTESKIFPKGTFIISGPLKFTLDEETRIASASENPEGLTFGKITARVTASEIGTEANLPTGTNFTLKDLSVNSYYAKNTAQFTGGTSREISSVSREDQERLLTFLSQELGKKAKEKINSRLDHGEKLLDEFLKTEIISKKYNRDIGSEAREISLTLTLKSDFLSYNEKDLINLLRTNLTAIPIGFLLDEKKTNVKVMEIKSDKEGNFPAKIQLSVPIIPKIDNQNIISQIRGKSFQEASLILKGFQNIGGVRFTEETNLPFWNKKLPLRGENIEIQIVTE